MAAVTGHSFQVNSYDACAQCHPFPELLAQFTMTTIGTRIQDVKAALDQWALTKAPEELAGHPWTRGVLLGRGRLRDFLARAGVEPIGTEGEPFDPTVHEALFYEERPGLADRRVATVIRPGYRMGGRVLRPAQVGVVGPGGDEPSRTDDQTGGEDRVVGNGA